jgi:hypothetical protein
MLAKLIMRYQIGGFGKCLMAEWLVSHKQMTQSAQVIAFK